MGISDKCKRDGSTGLFHGLISCAAVCAAAVLAPSAATAETWYWVGNQMTSQRYWDGLSNWTNALGEAGDPARGDNAVFNDNTLSAPYLVCNSNGGDTGSKVVRKALNSIVFDGFKKSCNQGNFAFIGGGEGLTVLGANYNVSHYTGILLEGEGEVPFNIVDASSEFRGQMRVVVRKDPNGVCNNLTLVKKGLGSLISYYQAGSREYEIPLNKIQQGKLDVTTSRTLTGIKFQFDGNDPSARLSWGYNAKIQFNLGTGCAILEDGVANTDHGIECPYNLQLCFTGDPAVNPMTFTGQFYGGAGLLWNPSSTDCSFVYSTAVCATTGSVAAVSGTIKLVNGASFTSLSSLSVGTTGVLEVEQGSGANFRADTLDLLTGGKLKLDAGVVVTVHTATLDTLPLLAGTYAATEGEGVTAASWIEGDGQVVVETGDISAAKWIGGGASNGIAVEGNWSPSTPNLAAGNTFAVFAEGGNSASLDRDARFAGLSLKGGFDFTGNGTISIGDMGAASLDVATATEYNFACPVELSAGQTWSVGTNNTFNVSGGLSGGGSLAVAGDGVFNVGGVSTLAGPVNIGTKATISGLNALGAAGTLSRVRNDSGAICFSSATNDAAVSFYSVAAGKKENVVSFAGDSLFNGPVTNSMGTLYTAEGATVEFANKFKGDVLDFSGTGTVVFRGKMELGGNTWTMYMDIAGSNPTVEFHAANNTFSGIFWSSLLYGRIKCHVPYAIQASGAVNEPGQSKGTRLIMGNAFTLDLCGNDQSVDGISATNGGTVTSDDPAFLHHVAKNPYNVNNDPDNANANRTNNLVFAGMAGFSYDGPMTNRLGGVSTTGGTLQVTKGKLIVLPQASWLNSTNVVVSGGVLAVENPNAFSDKVIVNISGEGQMALDFAEGAIKCDYLFIDGRKMPGGRYTAAKDPLHFTGSGVLEARARGLQFYLK